MDQLKRHYQHGKLESLHSFSAVCRRLRQITSPVIFSRCSTSISVASSPRHYGNSSGTSPEVAIQHYLNSLCSVLSFTGERSADTVELSVEHLERAMPSFEVLESVRFHEIFGSSIVLAIPAVLTAPHLRALHVIDQCPYSEPDLKDEDLASDLPPDQIPSSIVELRWCRDQWSFATDAQISDGAALIRALAFPLRLSLQILSVPIESAPIHELSTLVWPHLIDLSLTANTPSSATTSSIDFSSILDNMPRLLNLSVSLPQSSSFLRSTILLPITSTTTPPLESLRSLTLAYPNPSDLIFDHLPPSLHHLSLTDCPRHYLLLDTSNPHRSLLASALSPLQHLRHLYIHLNPPETPQFRPGQSGDRRRIALAAFRKALQDTANMFAGAFASSCLEVIFLLERFYGETRWSRWREIRSGDENGKEDGKEHAYCERVDGFEIQ